MFLFRRKNKTTFIIRHDSIEWTNDDAQNLRYFLGSETGKKTVAMIEDNAFARFMNGRSKRKEVTAVLSVIEYMRRLSPEQTEPQQKTEGQKTTTIQKGHY